MNFWQALLLFSILLLSRSTFGQQDTNPAPKHNFLLSVGPAGTSTIPTSIYGAIEYIPDQHWAYYSTLRRLEFEQSKDDTISISNTKLQIGVKYYPADGPKGIFYNGFIDLYQPSAIAIGAGLGYQAFILNRIGFHTGIAVHTTNTIEQNVSIFGFRFNLGLMFSIKKLYDPFNH